MCVYVYVLVAQSCLTLCNPMDCSPPGSSVHGILQARILELVAISLSRGSSQPKDQTQVSCIAGGFFTTWANREAQWLTPTFGSQFDPLLTFYTPHALITCNSSFLFKHLITPCLLLTWTALLTLLSSHSLPSKIPSRSRWQFLQVILWTSSAI